MKELHGASSRLASLAAALLASLLCVACHSPLVRPADGSCVAADPALWQRHALGSLTVKPFRARRLYGIATGRESVVFEPAEVPQDSVAVVSYPVPDRFDGGPYGFDAMASRSFVYDNALYVILKTVQGDCASARRVLQTLVALQRADGAWGASFNLEGRPFYNVGYVRSGHVAWVAYAMALYAVRFKDKRFVVAMRKAASWLLARRDPKTGLVLGGLGRFRPGGGFDRHDVADWASTEHNVDLWFALRAFAVADPEGGWARHLQPDELGDAIEKHLFIPAQGRYARGLRSDGLDKVSALDAAGTWSALFELGRGRVEVAERMLVWLESHHGHQQDGWQAWRPYGADEASDRQRLWFVEASVARAIVLHRLGRHEEARKMVRQLSELACAGGVPLVYSNRWAEDFPMTPAVAPTVWYVLAVSEVWGAVGPQIWPTPVQP